MTHVNTCIDGLAQAREVPPPNNPDQFVPTTLIGPWTCRKCISGQWNSVEDDICGTCGSRRGSSNVEDHEPPRPDNLTIAEGGILYRKIFLIGDPMCGKTWLASVWSGGAVPAFRAGEGLSYSNTFKKEVTAHSHHLELEICDFNGDESWERLRRQSYTDVRLVLMCFDISNYDSLENVEEKWVHEANGFLHDIPKILVGCKRDLRSTNMEVSKGHSTQRLVGLDHAGRVAQRIGALAYFETSATAPEGLEQLSRYVAKALIPKPVTNKGLGLLKFWARN
ncbi:P-loop containing nucleoside triphosphate hydrolase protein [Paraphoma chrysanthemicola]|nr:P-loop containing nucleoside triphosphate hydrolase protein [Paraphoma chrysanthemicola]